MFSVRQHDVEMRINLTWVLTRIHAVCSWSSWH